MKIIQLFKILLIPNGKYVSRFRNDHKILHSKMFSFKLKYTRAKPWPPLVTGLISDILGNSAVGET